MLTRLGRFKLQKLTPACFFPDLERSIFRVSIVTEPVSSDCEARSSYPCSRSRALNSQLWADSSTFPFRVPRRGTPRQGGSSLLLSLPFSSFVLPSFNSTD